MSDFILGNVCCYCVACWHGAGHWSTQCGENQTTGKWGCNSDGGPSYPPYAKIFYGVDRMPLVIRRLREIGTLIKGGR